MKSIKRLLGRNTNSTKPTDPKDDNIKCILGLTPRPGTGNVSKLDAVDLSQPEVSTSFLPQSQSKSLFFTLLPYEIRLQIYRYVLGDGHEYHIVDATGHPRRRLAHFHCFHGPFPTHCCNLNPCSSDNTRSDWCLRPSPFTARKGSPLPPPRPCPKIFHPDSFSNASLALLRTCHQAYSEARLFPYLYNHFRFSYLDTFIAFSLCVRPVNFAAIRHLQVYWEIFWPLLKDRTPSGPLGIQAYGDRVWFQGLEIYTFQSDESWLTFWDLVSGAMPALEELRFKLAFPPGELAREQRLVHAFGDDKGLKMSLDADWLQPVLKARGLKKFEFRLEESDPPPGGREKCLDEIKEIVCRPAGR